MAQLPANPENSDWLIVTVNGVPGYLIMPKGTLCAARPTADAITQAQLDSLVDALPTVAGYTLSAKNCDIIDLSGAIITDVVLGGTEADDTTATAPVATRLTATFTY